MIELIELRNFQCWDRLKLELEQVTCLVGPNGSGKTAVIRALYWLCFGRPLGDKFLAHGSDTCLVGVQLDGDRRIGRRLASGSSAYRVDGSKVLKAFGTSVPDEVQRLLNIAPVNFQRQLDAPFWMLESPGQAAKNLNAIVNLDLIDMAMSEMGSRVKKTIATSQIVDNRVLDLSGQVEALSWVDEFDADLCRVEQCEEELKQVEEELISLRMGADNVVRCQKKRDKLKAIVSHDGMLDDLDRINALDDRIAEVSGSLKRLWRDFKATDHAATKAIGLSADVDATQHEFDQAIKERCPTCNQLLNRKSR